MVETTTILVGGSPYSNQNTGHVQIHYLLPPLDHDAVDDTSVLDTMVNDNGQSPFTTITLKGNNIGDEFGSAVALSKSGTVLAVASSKSGYVQVYQYSKFVKEWIKMGNIIVGRINNEDVPNVSNEQQQEYFGHQVALNSDGTRLVVSSSRFMSDGSLSSSSSASTSTTDAIDGYVQVYEWRKSPTDTADADIDATSINQSNDGGNWIPMGNKITGDVESKEECGASIDISNDGTIVAIGCPRYSYNEGRVKVYRYTEDEAGKGSWVQIRNDLIGDSVEDYFGSQLSMLGNGLYFAATAASGWSRCYKYKKEEEDFGWHQLGNDISIVSLRNGLFGGSISLSTFRHYVQNTDDKDMTDAVDGLVVVRGLYFLDDWALNPGFATVRWIPLRDNDDDDNDDWTYVGQDVIGQDFGDKYGVSTAVATIGDSNQLMVAVGADSRQSGRVHVLGGTVAM